MIYMIYIYIYIYKYIYIYISSIYTYQHLQTSVDFSFKGLQYTHMCF